MEEDTEKERAKSMQVVPSKGTSLEFYGQRSAEMGKSSIKSSATVKFNAVAVPSKFLELQSNTNLNQPPENWLKAPLKLFGSEKRETESLFTSFRMAAAFPDTVGKVDVISDAENIKKLMKIPYSKGPVSMMVHRIGNTLLLDDFDIRTHLLRSAENEWSWLKKFYSETILRSLQENHKGSRTTKNNKHSRGYLQKKNLIAKFLYHTLAAIQDPQYPLQENVQSLAQHQQCQAVMSFPEVLLQQSLSEVKPENRALLQHARNISWTFEDIRMLIGTDLPIFGGGTHPCVSLRLREMSKPINVLTGLDYWLDNLMCNVPEVVMCYHLEGIVQKYELVKTEDLPDLPQSKFNPGVVRDVAQNILSFLKSKATKAGHTYWLFKSKDDDVVKLYDLTSLCSDLAEDPSLNPFTTPVAILLYKVAQNLRNSKDWRLHWRTIISLLKKCCGLIDPNHHPQLAIGVWTLMANTYLPKDSGFSSKEEPDQTEEYQEEQWDDLWEEPHQEDENSACSVDVRTLCTPNGIEKNRHGSGGRHGMTEETLEERCQSALESTAKAIRLMMSVQKQKDKENQQQEEPSMASPLKPIPMPYQSLRVEEPEADNLKIEKKKTETENLQHWITYSLEKCIHSYVTLAESSVTRSPVEAEQIAHSLHYLNMAALLWRSLNQPLPDITTKNALPALPSVGATTSMQSYAMGVSGDVYFHFVQEWSKATSLNHSPEYFMNEHDYAILDVLEQYFGPGAVKTPGTAFPCPSSLQESLELSMSSYQSALLLLGLSIPRGSATLEEDYSRLAKRLGNVCNEMGVFYMSKMTSLLENPDIEEDGSRKMRFLQLFQASQTHLEAGVATFKKVKDVANAALLLSNLGKLYRLQAKALAPSEMKELGMVEWKCYQKACQSYEEGLKVLQDRKDHPGIWDAVTWELSSTLFTLATLLQDYAPLSVKSREEIESEISKVLVKCLELCDVETPGPRQPLYQYRAATAHYRLASLYHDKYRNGTGEAFVNGKNVRGLAENHYSLSLDLYGHLENWDEYLRVILEHIGVYEFQLKNLTGTGSKLRVLQAIVNVLVKSKAALDVFKKSGDFDVKAVTSLVVHLIQRLQSTLLHLAKLHKAGKKSSAAEAAVYVKMYSKSLTVDVKDPELIAKTADLVTDLAALK